MKKSVTTAGKFSVKRVRDGGWVGYTDRQFFNRPTPRRHGYTYKLRLNIPQESYTDDLVKSISQFILNHMTNDCKSADKLLMGFKFATKKIQSQWKGERFTSNGQFTLYLLEPANLVKLRDFITELQAYLTRDLHLGSAAPMDSDFAVCNTDNISMRLERIDGEYCNSTLIHDVEVVGDAYRFLMRDTQRYATFATNAPAVEFREHELDDVHRMLWRGYHRISTLQPVSMLVGNAFQILALIKRKMLNIRSRPEADAEAEISALLATPETQANIIAAVESIKVQEALRIRPNSDDAFQTMLQKDSDFGRIIASVYEKPAKDVFLECDLKNDRLYMTGTSELTNPSYKNILADRLYVNCTYPHRAGSRVDYRIMERDILTLLKVINSGDEDIKRCMATIAGQPGVDFVISKLTDPTAKAYLSCLRYRAIRKLEAADSGSDHHRGLFNFFQSEAFRAPTKLSAVNKLIDRFEKPGVSEALTVNEAKAVTTKRMKALVGDFDLLNPAAACYAGLAIVTSVAEYKSPGI
ncbi:MAG: hypothetical protein P1U40_04260 [Coxiellaceae bacterium]|nr:hypothetical protein [Coxiellaceae bacterium]